MATIRWYPIYPKWDIYQTLWNNLALKTSMVWAFWKIADSSPHSSNHAPWTTVIFTICHNLLIWMIWTFSWFSLPDPPAITLELFGSKPCQTIQLRHAKSDLVMFGMTFPQTNIPTQWPLPHLKPQNGLAPSILEFSQLLQREWCQVICPRGEEEAQLVHLRPELMLQCPSREWF